MQDYSVILLVMCFCNLKCVLEHSMAISVPHLFAVSTFFSENLRCFCYWFHVWKLTFKFWEMALYHPPAFTSVIGNWISLQILRNSPTWIGLRHFSIYNRSPCHYTNYFLFDMQCLREEEWTHSWRHQFCYSNSAYDKLYIYKSWLVFIRTWNKLLQSTLTDPIFYDVSRM